MLLAITARKAVAVLRREHRQKRGGGAVRGESVFRTLDGDGPAGIDQVLGHEPTPEFAAQVEEEYHNLLAQLDDETLRQIALLNLEGFTSDDIRIQLNCSLRTVERKLERIRSIWERTLKRRPDEN